MSNMSDVWRECTHLPSKSPVSIASRMTLSTAVVISSCDAYGAQTFRIALSCRRWEGVGWEEKTNARVVVPGHLLCLSYGHLHVRREELSSSQHVQAYTMSIEYLTLPRKHERNSTNTNRTRAYPRCAISTSLSSASFMSMSTSSLGRLKFSIANAYTVTQWIRRRRQSSKTWIRACIRA